MWGNLSFDVVALVAFILKNIFACIFVILWEQCHKVSISVQLCQLVLLLWEGWFMFGLEKQLSLPVLHPCIVWLTSKLGAIIYAC